MTITAVLTSGPFAVSKLKAVSVGDGFGGKSQAHQRSFLRYGDLVGDEGFRGPGPGRVARLQGTIRGVGLASQSLGECDLCRACSAAGQLGLHLRKGTNGRAVWIRGQRLN